MDRNPTRARNEPFSRIAVVNRGEPAVRFLRALRDYNRERGTAFTSVAFYTVPDRAAPFLRLADDAVALGPALRPAADGTMVSAYTDHERVIEALVAAGCDAVWPGWGFIAEDAAFVAKLEARGIQFIGPSSVAMQRLGDKIAAKRLADEAGVPMAAWHVLREGEPLEVTLEAARKIGFPLVVKASAGGGGRGIRMVTEARALGAAIKAVHDEVARSFRAGGIFLEGCVQAARHIEVQLVVGADGVGAALGIRDCSIQRKHQKVIEEAPSPVVFGALAVELERSAARLGEIVAYRGVATVEFLVDPARDFAHFLEVNTRLQVEHTVTETVMGIDLVHVQLDIARGLPWQRPNASVDAAGSYEPRGHAIEVRLNAEDPERDFQPSPGLVRVFRPPLGPGIRVDSGVAEGVVIAPEFDSMIAKIIVQGRDRTQALARLGRALRELEISVEDGATNKAFLSELIEDAAVVDATADTGWLDRRMAGRTNAVVPGAFEALCVAAIVVRQGALAETVKAFFSDVQSGIPYRFEASSGGIALSLRGVSVTFDAHCVGPDGQDVGQDLSDVRAGSRWLVGPRPISGRAALTLHDARLEPIGGAGAGSAILHLSDGLRTTRHAVLTSVGRTGIAVEVDGRSHLVELTAGGLVKAPAPALVVAVHVAIGAEVEVGTRLCTLEAMKMEVPVLAREAGVVRQIGCRPNEQVQAGQALFEIESVGRAPRIAMSSDTPRPVVRALTWLFPDGKPDPGALQALPASEATRAVVELCQVLRWALVGWDVPEAFVARAEELLACEDAFRHVAQPHLFRPLADVLGAFSDVEQLFVQELASDSGSRPIAGKVAFFEVCRTLAARNAATASDELVANYTPRLLRVLAHHGVSSLVPSAPLSEALWRLARANAQSDVRQRLANQLLRALMALNEAGLELGDMRELELFLARTAEVARPELPALRDNARQARYVMFRRKRLMGRSEPTFAQRLAELAVGEDALPMLRELYGVDAAIAQTQPDRFEVIGHGGAPTTVMLVSADNWPAVLVSPPAAVAEVAVSPPAAVAEVAVSPPAAVAEVAVSPPAAVAEVAVSPPAAVAEVHVLVVGRSDALCIGRLEAAYSTCAARVAFTWTLDGEHELHRVYVDGSCDALLSDVHPERARRLELWRLANFDLQRIPSPDRIVALRARAKANPKDERIIVMAEVQRVPASLAEARGPQASSEGTTRGDDAAGQRELEWAFAESLRILREAQAQRDASQRYFLNRIVLHVGPVLNATQETLMQIARRLEGATRGHGLQKVVVQAKVVRDGQVTQRVFTFATRGRHRLEVHEKLPSDAPVRAASDLHLRSERARRLGTIYPYEMVRSLEGTPDVGAVATAHPDMVHGRFVEYDLDAAGVLVPVTRPHGQNRAGVVVGLMTHVTRKHPEGMTRVWLASDSTTAMGALAEPECRRVLAAIALATELRVPIEWLPISSGAKIAMDSGTENLDWTARVLARDHRVYAARRRDQRHRRGRQRRRAELLERRSHDVDAHARRAHPDGRWLDGAHRQTCARGLGQRRGRRRTWHRRLRAHHGPERAGPVLRQEHRRRLPHLVRALHLQLRRARRTWPTPPREQRPGDTLDPRLRARVGRRPDPHRRHLQRRDQPRPQEAVRDPRGHARDHRPRRWPARALRRPRRWRDRGRVGRAHGRAPGHGHRLRVEEPRASRQSPARRTRPLERRHVVPAELEEGRARAQPSERQQARRRHREPVGLRW